MKIKIGPYLTFWGAFQIADLLQHVGVSEDRCHAIGDWLSKTWVGDACQYIYDKRHRTAKIKIDYYDTWSMDHTLALIIVPMLKQLRDTKHGSPYVAPEDAPPEFTGSPTEHGSDDKIHERWDWVLNEIIWAFEDTIEENDMTGFHSEHHDFDVMKARYNRQQAAFILFGKYYRALWD